MKAVNNLGCKLDGHFLNKPGKKKIIIHSIPQDE